MATKKQNNPKPPKKNNARDWRNFLWYVLIIFIVISFISAGMGNPEAPDEINFSEFSNFLNSGQITKVTIQSSERIITGETKDGTKFKTYYINYPGLVDELREQKIALNINPKDSGWMWGLFVQALLPFLLIGFLWFFIFRQASGANNQAMSFGKSKAKSWSKEDKKKIVTFKDVAGADEAVEELKEIVDFLKKPKKFIEIGAKIPKGALLMGSPGTGKTLLAKAVAGEADVPFFSISGSEFVEMFVGVGASRVRDLFKQAKKDAPSIIFVDEIDAVGRHRGAGLGGGHDEREQTLNQLLVEMDGFDSETTVIVLAGTNRPDILDPALLRPGRFDRQITVDKPDQKGRLEILKIHAKNKKMAKNVDLKVIAKGTAGFTGADLANLLNEGALLSARRNRKTIGKEELEESVERVIAGPERKSRILSDKEQEIVAYHEVGHALVAANVDPADPVHKISILPRGMALGYTLQLPEEDKHLISKAEILAQIQTLLGGRIAEELTFNEITSGASNDIEKVTSLAHRYVCTFGMSDTLGPRKFGKSNGQVFLGKSYSDHDKDYSEATAKAIDEEMEALINDCYIKAKKILVDNKDKLESISKLLLKKEVIDSKEFLKLIAKKPEKKTAVKK